MKRTIVPLVLLWQILTVPVLAQRQAGMVEKSGGGMTFDAEQYKIDMMRIKSQQSENKYRPPAELPKEFKRPKKQINSSGEIWIEGYCRYRPATSSTSRYNSNMSEREFCEASYPSDTVFYMDYFKGSGNINWCSNTEREAQRLECEDIMKAIAESNQEGITYKQYRRLFDVSSLPSTYEFSRGVFYTIKRMDGSATGSVEITGYYGFSNGEDFTNITISDKGIIRVMAYYENGESTREDIKTGKSKYWRPGEWNEVGIIKDHFNTVRVMINGMEECRYQTPDLPIATRFYRFGFECLNINGVIGRSVPGIF